MEVNSLWKEFAPSKKKIHSFMNKPPSERMLFKRSRQEMEKMMPSAKLAKKSCFHLQNWQINKTVYQFS